jgi:hypothetical protein
MSRATGNDHQHVVTTINQAIGLAGNDQIVLAVQLLTSLVAEFPGASAAHGYLAWFLSQIRRDKDAIEHSRVAVCLSQKSEIASLVHFHVLWRAGKRDEARDEMRRFLTIRSSDEYLTMIQAWAPGDGDCQAE